MTVKRGLPSHAALGDMLYAAAAVQPEKAAVIFQGRHRTYRELDKASNRTANALIASPFPPRSSVGILSKNSDYYIEILFATVKSGNTALLLNWRLAAPELEAIAADADLAVVFYDMEFEDRVQVLKSKLSQAILYIPFDGMAGCCPAYDGFQQKHDANRPAVVIAPNDDAILMYTSGSTGKPKGVPTTHFAVCFAVENITSLGPVASSIESDINLLTTPLFHLAALGWIFGTIFSSATLVIPVAIDMPSIIEAIAQYRVTRAVVLPALMPALLDSVKTGVDLSSLRSISYGASPIPETLLERMLENLNCSFLQNYGMTEITGSATFLGPDDHTPGNPHLLSCGKPYPNVDLRVVRADGTACALSEVGEVQLRTPSLFKGYKSLPEASAEVLKDGWYLTGDMGYLDAQNYLFLRDRKKDMIISGGENIYPAEIESALSAHPAVVRVAVIGVPSEKWGEEVKAVVISSPDSKITGAELIAFLRPLIAGYKLPKSVDFVAELPLTAVGKIAKPVLREIYWAGKARRLN